MVHSVDVSALHQHWLLWLLLFWTCDLELATWNSAWKCLTDGCHFTFLTDSHIQTTVSQTVSTTTHFVPNCDLTVKGRNELACCSWHKKCFVSIFCSLHSLVKPAVSDDLRLFTVENYPIDITVMLAQRMLAASVNTEHLLLCWQAYKCKRHT